LPEDEGEVNHDIATVIVGDARAKLAELSAGSVHCCVTSPPYFGLRAYKAGDAEVGRETTVEGYLDSLMSVFGSAENPVGVWRVLRDDGLCWVNLGTSYAGSWGDSGHRPERDGIAGEQRAKNSKCFVRNGQSTENPATSKPKELGVGYKPGDLIDIPSLFAERMRRAGWYLRSRVTWIKGVSLADDYSGSCMPESAAANGTYWVRHRVKTRRVQSPESRGQNPESTDRDEMGTGVDGVDLVDEVDQAGTQGTKGIRETMWRDCPGCPKCSPHGGYVLKRGNGRPTNSTEAVLMFAKSETYYYDSHSVREPVSPVSIERVKHPFHPKKVAERSVNCDGDMSRFVDPSGRCLRSAWWLPLENATDAWFLNPGGNSDVAGKHFAMFPAKLPELCIKMSTSERGVCPKCGAAWARVIESRHDSAHTGTTDSAYETGTTANRLALLRQQARKNGGEFATQSRTIGWRPTCGCDEETGEVRSERLEARAQNEEGEGTDRDEHGRTRTEYEAVAAVVLDPFSGMATTGVAAVRLGRTYIGIELSEKYAEASRRRLAAATRQGRLGL
jgi:DNA modification methylase